MSKLKVAGFGEGSLCGIYEFDTEAERIAFCHGWSEGADKYGAGSAPAYRIPEELGEMSDEERDDFEERGDQYEEDDDGLDS